MAHACNESLSVHVLVTHPACNVYIATDYWSDRYVAISVDIYTYIHMQLQNYSKHFSTTGSYMYEAIILLKCLSAGLSLSVLGGGDCPRIQ